MSRAKCLCHSTCGGAALPSRRAFGAPKHCSSSCGGSRIASIRENRPKHTGPEAALLEGARLAASSRGPYARRAPMNDDAARLRAALFGRFRLERVLGRGGMATVWLAQDLKLDRPIALKVLRPDIASA